MAKKQPQPKTKEPETEEPELPYKHCYDYINEFGAPGVLRWFLLIQSLPATHRVLARQFGANPKLFADYQGKRYRVVMASRMGDVGLSENFQAEDGYSIRTAVQDLSNFSDTP